MNLFLSYFFLKKEEKEKIKNKYKQFVRYPDNISAYYAMA